MKFMLALVFFFVFTAKLNAECNQHHLSRSACETDADGQGCWWDTSKESFGHPCTAFSGDCTSIMTNDSTSCTGAGRGNVANSGKCKYIPGTSECVDNCTRLLNGPDVPTNAQACINHPYCEYVVNGVTITYWRWGNEPNGCQETEHFDGYYCQYSGCAAEAPGCNTQPYCYQDYRCYADKDAAVAAITIACNEKCEVKYITKSSCDGTSSSPTGCHWDDDDKLCREGSAPPTPSGCAVLNQANCYSNNGCYYNSFTGLCKNFYPSSLNCREIHSTTPGHVGEDCEKAGDRDTCLWVPDTGCVSKNCKDLDYSGCVGDNSCWWYDGLCREFTSCPAVSAVSGTYSSVCLNAGVPGTCNWDGDATTGSECKPATTCLFGNSEQYCNDPGISGNPGIFNACFWNRTGGGGAGACVAFGNCGNVQTITGFTPDDCNNAGIPGVSCWYNGGATPTCVAKTCANIGTTSYLDCVYKDDCWWNSSLGACNSFTACNGTNGISSASITQDDCENAGDRNTCWYNDSATPAGLKCINKTAFFTTCIAINNSKDCSIYPDCHWNSTSCVGACGQLSEEDCWDRGDCYWDSSNDYCYPHGDGVSCGSYNGNNQYNIDRCNGLKNCYSYYGSCITFANCNFFYTSYSQCPSEKRCEWDWKDEKCVDDLTEKVITPFKTLGCGGYYNITTCNADPKCVWNSQYHLSSSSRGICMDFTGCGDIKFVEFGGYYSNPRGDCGNKGCVWNSLDFSTYGQCGSQVGLCLENGCSDLSPELCERAVNCNYNGTACEPVKVCGDHKDSEKCYAQAGCMWNTGSGYALDGSESCTYKSCNEFNNGRFPYVEEYCNAVTDCQYVRSGSNEYCLPKCESYTTENYCPQVSSYGINYCYWDASAADGSKCKYFSGDCSLLTTSDTCSQHCIWVSNSKTDLNQGNCYDNSDEYYIKNYVIRGCEDIINLQQCVNSTFTASVGLPTGTGLHVLIPDSPTSLHPPPAGFTHKYDCVVNNSFCVLSYVLVPDDIPPPPTCNSYSDMSECYENASCYWNLRTHCQEIVACAEIVFDYVSYSGRKIECHDHPNCIWDSYTKTCEDFGAGDLSDFHNPRKDCMGKSGYWVPGTSGGGKCYPEGYEEARPFITSCGVYKDGESCSADVKYSNGDVDCSGIEYKGCAWSETGGGVCEAFIGCPEITDRDACNSKPGCRYYQGVCAVAPSMTGNTLCNRIPYESLCNIEASCNWQEGVSSPCQSGGAPSGFQTRDCSGYSSGNCTWDKRKGTGEGCTWRAGIECVQDCAGHLVEEKCNGDNYCVWDDYHKICKQFDNTENSINSVLSDLYARQKACTSKGYYWDGNYNCQSNIYNTPSNDNNQCSFNENPFECNLNRKSYQGTCYAGCVWNSNNQSCTVLRGCSFIDSQGDCNAKKECVWNTTCKDVECSGLSQGDCTAWKCSWGSIAGVSGCYSSDQYCQALDLQDPPAAYVEQSYCWGDDHYRPYHHKPVWRCLDIGSENECKRLQAIGDCYWQKSSDEFPVGVCFEGPTPPTPEDPGLFDCSVVKNQAVCELLPGCYWPYSGGGCAPLPTNCTSITSRLDCEEKAGECEWNTLLTNGTAVSKCITPADCSYFNPEANANAEAKAQAEINCNLYFSSSWYPCVYVWPSSGSGVGTCTNKNQEVGGKVLPVETASVVPGIYVNRTQCFDRGYYWKKSLNPNNVNKGNCFSGREYAGVTSCSNLCDESDCLNYDVHTDVPTYPCFWNGSYPNGKGGKGKCLSTSVNGITEINCRSIKDLDLCVKKNLCFWNSSHDSNKGSCETFAACSNIDYLGGSYANAPYDCERKPNCSWNSTQVACIGGFSCGISSKPLDCSFNKQCYWDTALSRCTYFWGCDEIASEKDCKDRACGWNTKKAACGDAPSTKAKWSNGATAATVVLAVLLFLAVVAVVILVVFIILKSRGNSVGNSASSGSEQHAAGGGGESTADLMEPDKTNETTE